MTKDEYEDFVLRYKGCGACFPMYHTLSRFKKMWFSAIQKDVAYLEKENAELKKFKRECETSLCRAEYQYNYEQLTKAKEFLKKFMPYVIESYLKQDISNIKLSFSEIEEAEQFLSEVEK